MKGAPRRHLSRLDGVVVLVGVVIGMGVFQTPSLVAARAGDAMAALALWTIGGVVSVLGALVYAELASANPDSGGEYAFLSSAYGARVARLFGWARLAIIQPGTIAASGFVVGSYLAPFAPAGVGAAAIAALVVVLAVAVNLSGVGMSKHAQGLFAAALVASLAALALCGLLFAPDAPPPAAPASNATDAVSYGGALIFVLLAYGGWSEAAYLAGESRRPQRDMLVMLVGGVAVVSVLYVAVNAAFFRVLGFEGVATSANVGAAAAERIFGALGGAFVTLFVVAACVSTANATLFTGARSAHALGRDVSAFRLLGGWSERAGQPLAAILAQGVVALALVGLGAATKAGFETMVAYTAPVFWLFFTLVALSSIILRRREPGRVLPFRMPLYPAPALASAGVGAFMTVSAVSHAQSQAFSLGAIFGLVALAAGVAIVAGPRSARRV